MTQDLNLPEQTKGMDSSRTWVDKLEFGVISVGRIFAILMWAILAAPVWLVMIIVALFFLLLLTVVRALTARNFSIDRLLLRMVARTYPNGFRFLRAEFNKLEKEMEDDDEDVIAERSYLFSTIQSVLLLVIAIAAYCLYSRINVLSLPEYAYAGTAVVVFAAVLIAWNADRRGKYAQPGSPSDEKSEARASAVNAEK